MIKINYSLILERRFKGNQWSLAGYNYEDLIWYSKNPQPTKQTLDALWDEVQDEIENEKLAKVAAKAAAQAKLAALGLTTEDLQALGL